MNPMAISENIWWVGALDPDLRVFDIIMRTEHGTSYNAYVVKGANKIAVIETVKEKFFPEYRQRLEQVINLSQIDYIVVNHTEPDHVGSVAELLKLAPQAMVVGSSIAISFLKQIANREFKNQTVTEGDTIDLGGKTLQFIDAPFLHWPDSIYTYVPEEQILFTCDSFGSHYAGSEVFNDLIAGDFTEAYKYYYDHILAPFRPYLVQALDKIEKLPMKMICPGHGPVLRSNLQHYFDLYREWSKGPETMEKPAIVVAYVSAYGYTRSLAQSIVDGMGMVGDFDIHLYDLVETPVSEVMPKIDTALGLVLGSPTINGDALPPIWQVLTNLSPVVHGNKLAGAFGAYGWSGEAVPNIEYRLKALRMDVMSGIKINFKPTELDLEKAFAWGTDFSRKLVDRLQPKAKTQWRCLVCGQVFEGEEAPHVCPACGASQENFVRVLAEEEYINDTSEAFVIIGGGIAALSTAEAIRKRNRQGTIKIYSEEPVAVYYRPALSDYLSEDLSGKDLFVHDEAWYQDNKIELYCEARVTTINTESKSIVLADGSQVSYDKLVIATGARPNVPPLPGTDKAGVHSLRNLGDARAIKLQIGDSKQAVVIGGGVLGLEAAWELKNSGLEVAIVEFMPRIMPRQMDEDGSARLQQLIADAGVQLYLGVSTEEIQGNQQVTGVKLSNGEILPADLVILSTGVKPNIELASEAGMEVKRGIIVDSRMRTSSAAVYACGDVAEINGVNIGLWPISIEQGRVAGANAAGDGIEYAQPPLSTMLIAFNKEIFSVGDVNQPPDQCRIVQSYDPTEDTYKKYFMKDGNVLGAIIIAPRVKTAAVIKAVGKGGKVKATKWKCRRCGYIHEGPEPPETCPVCGAPKSFFDPIS